jgi:glutamate-ammonia-ligase adenylyltransferase
MAISLSQRGFLEPEKAEQNLKSIGNTLSDKAVVSEIISIIVEASANSFDPDRALNNYERFFASIEDANLIKIIIPDAERSLRILSFLFSGSQYLTDILIKNPSYVSWLINPEMLKKSRFKDGMYNDISYMFSKADSYKDKANSLRRFRNREFLRIGLRDLMKEADTIETIEDLSNVADICLQKAYEYCNEELEKKYGIPYFEDERDGLKKKCEFVILGMGKHGGRELNFSSDIDLLYVYSSDRGVTSGIESTDGKIENQITNHEYFVQLARMVTKMVSEITDEGYAFRIDLDLRPEGKSGDITNSLRSAEIYYESWGETWERQALLKCRPAAGSMALGKKFVEMVKPFIFRKYLDFSALREIKEMKEKINKSLEQKGSGRSNVKLGYGGIREIEFIVQSFQLIYGGKEKWFRERNCMRALHRISEKGLLSYAEYFSLSNAYLFLRDLENRIQLFSGRQTHDIPDENGEQFALARKMFIVHKNSNPKLMDLYDYHTKNVRKIYDNLFSSEIYDVTEVMEGELQWQIDIDDAVSSIEMLRQIGFKSPEMTRRNLLLMRDGGAFAHPTIRSKRCFNQMLPSLLRECTKLPDPDLSINNFEKFIDAGRVREGIYSVLSKSEVAVRSLCSLFGTSQFLSNILIQQPELVDSLLIAEGIYKEKTKGNLRDEMEKILSSADSYEKSLDELCKFKRGEELRIGLRDILGIAEFAEVSSELSNLADVYVEFSVKLTEDEIMNRYGIPMKDGIGEMSRFAVIGLGKLGGVELNFGSDLDIVFVYSDDGETGGIQGGKNRLSNQTFFSKLCEKLIFAIGGVTRFGFAYRVDTRLRPDGEKGPLVMPIKGYEDYYKKRGEVWERQALIKSRFIAGDERLGMSLINIMHKFVYDDPFEEDMAEEIDRMRKRMELELVKGGETKRNIKLGKGGIVDIEFIVQLLQLKNGGRFKELRKTGSIEALKILYERRLITEEDFRMLSAGYIFLRRIENRLRIDHDRPLTIMPESKDELSLLAKRLGYKENGGSSVDRFYKDYEACSENVRGVYNKIFGVD